MPEIPKGAKKPMDRLVAEAHADSTEEGFLLGGAPIRVLPRGQWKKWALSAMLHGDLDRWATGAVHPDDVKAFVGADVTLAETEDFLTRWGEAVGENVGELGASRPS